MQISTESVELEELREMKADVERREKAQATVLERQAKRLEELETLYKVCSPRDHGTLTLLVVHSTSWYTQ